MGEHVTALLIDVDDTICQYRLSADDALATAFDRVGVPPLFDAAQYRARFHDHVRDADDDVATVRERCFATLAREAGHDGAVGRAVASEYAAQRDVTDVCWLPDARETLSTLRESYALAAVTNGSRDRQRRKLEALDAHDWFDAVVYAGFDTAAKPDPEPFERALTALEADRSTAVVVGDTLGTDVAGAAAAGLRSVWLDHDPGSTRGETRADGSAADGSAADGSARETVRTRTDDAAGIDARPDWTIHSFAELADEPWTDG